MPAVSGCSNQCGAPARAMPLRSPLWRLHPAACRHRRSAGTQATHPGRAARSPGRARAGTLGRAVDRSGFRLSTSSPAGGALAHQGQAPGGGLSCHGQPGHRRHRPVPGSGTALADAAAGVARGLARADKAAGHRPCGAVQWHRRGRVDPPYRAAAGDRPGAPAGLPAPIRHSSGCRARASRKPMCPGRRWATALRPGTWSWPGGRGFRSGQCTGE